MESYVTIDSIVRTALIANGDESFHKYPRFLMFALQAAKDFYMDSAQDVKTVRLPMNDLKQVELPLDFVDWVKVGIVCGNRIKVLGVCETLPILTETDSCGNIKPYDNCGCGVNEFPRGFTTGIYGGYYFLNYINENGEITGGIYGYGGGYTDMSYFRLIRNAGSNGILQFSTEINSTDIYIEYISNGFDPKRDTVISTYAERAIEYYIHWKVATHKSGPSSGDAQGWEFQYYNELRKARRRTMDLTPRDILEISRMYYMQAPKY